jgi:CRP/FNR family cyclic AMP-dependent transcriptional regulator
METLEPLLRAHPFFKDLDDAQVHFMTECARNLRFHVGDFLMREGGDADSLILLRTGRATLEVHLPNRGAMQVENVGPGDVLGWSWLFPPYRWQLDARAVEPIVALVFDAKCVHAKMESDPRLGYAITKPLLKHMYDRLTRVRMARLDLYRSDAS